jgi:hypothetical protein
LMIRLTGPNLIMGSPGGGNRRRMFLSDVSFSKNLLFSIF